MSGKSETDKTASPTGATTADVGSTCLTSTDTAKDGNRLQSYQVTMRTAKFAGVVFLAFAFGALGVTADEIFGIGLGAGQSALYYWPIIGPLAIWTSWDLVWALIASCFILFGIIIFRDDGQAKLAIAAIADNRPAGPAVGDMEPRRVPAAALPTLPTIPAKPAVAVILPAETKDQELADRLMKQRQTAAVKAQA
jgi:hypothetical protein